MASSREMQQSSRPLTHRPSLSGSSTTTLPARQTHARANSHSSHSLLTTSLNPNHRVTRRKSVTNPGANVNALAAALRDSERSSALPIANPSSRRHTVSKGSTVRSGLVGSLPSPPPSFPKKTDVKTEVGGSAIDDNQDTSGDEGSDKLEKARVRRASDGQPLTKEGKKSSRVELRCEQCGKGYKHSSCLTKHLWEHTPEWSFTSKLLISKHQQVQLLEAASVLVAMNGTEDMVATPPDSAKDFPSDPESAGSPAASGYSEPGDRQSSADTTPPPSSEGLGMNPMSYRSKRHSSIGGFSRSYQSAPFASSNGQSNGLLSNGFGHSRQLSGDNRPTSSGVNTTGQEDRDLAAAVELLSCSFGSNNGRGTVTLPADAPPVPPVPSHYLSQASSLNPASFINSFPSRQPESFTRGDFRRDSVDTRTDEPMDSVMDDDYDNRSRARSDDDDDGVFGRMEE